MKKRRRLPPVGRLLGLGAMLCLLVICFHSAAPPPIERPFPPLPPHAAPLSASFFHRNVFGQNCKAKPYPLKTKLLAAVLPHYEPALWSEAAVWQQPREDCDTVVVLGPNHSGQGPTLTVSGQSWATEEGVLEGDATAAEQLLKTAALQGAPAGEAVAEEWSVAVHMPYVKHYFPQSRVVAITLSRSAQTSQLKALGAALAALAEQKRIVVLCSVDFSHYQTPQVAATKDEVTKKIIASGDLEALRALRGDHLDSPETMAVFLTLAEKLEKTPRLTDQFSISYQNGARAEAGTYCIYTLSA